MHHACTRSNSDTPNHGPHIQGWHQRPGLIHVFRHDVGNDADLVFMHQVVLQDPGEGGDVERRGWWALLGDG